MICAEDVDNLAYRIIIVSPWIIFQSVRASAYRFLVDDDRRTVAVNGWAFHSHAKILVKLQPSPKYVNWCHTELRWHTQHTDPNSYSTANSEQIRNATVRNGNEMVISSVVVVVAVSVCHSDISTFLSLYVCIDILPQIVLQRKRKRWQ